MDDQMREAIHLEREIYRTDGEKQLKLTCYLTQLIEGKPWR